MKTFILFAISIVAISAQAKTMLSCQDSSGTFYQVTREGKSSRAVLQEMHGRSVMASRVGQIQAAGQLDSYFVELSDQNGRFLLVGTDLNSPGWLLTGEINAFGARRSISCQLPH